jgi:hypothetical protein
MALPTFLLALLFFTPAAATLPPLVALFFAPVRIGTAVFAAFLAALPLADDGTLLPARTVPPALLELFPPPYPPLLPTAIPSNPFPHPKDHRAYVPLNMFLGPGKSDYLPVPFDNCLSISSRGSSTLVLFVWFTGPKVLSNTIFAASSLVRSLVEWTAR